MKQNQSAVSPLIGVTLMVIITVILAAVIASFIFGMGYLLPDPMPPPVVSTSVPETSIKDFAMWDNGEIIIDNKTIRVDKIYIVDKDKLSCYDNGTLIDANNTPYNYVIFMQGE